MIGSRCLRPGGSAVRSRAARAPSIVAAAIPSAAPLAECSYHTWQPPQLTRTAPRKQTCTVTYPDRRCFSCSSHSRRSHAGSPEASVAVDQHATESSMHDPPFTSAKVKCLRPVAGPAPVATPSASDAPPIKLADSAKGTPFNTDTSADRIRLAENPLGTPLHLPDSSLATRLAIRHSPPRAHPDIPPQLLLEFLTEPDEDAFQRIKAQLPPSFHRVDAYLLLRQIDPQSLSALSYRSILSLINRAGKDNLGAVLAMLLEDIIGPETSNAKGEPGLFQIFAGTEERHQLLRELLVRCNRSELLIHDGAALNVFLLMLDDFIQVRRSSEAGNAADGTASSIEGTLASSANGSQLTLPATFPVGETRRLVKLAVSLHSPELAPIVNAMQAHLVARTPDFPTAREGSQLIAYYLQPSLRDFSAALDVVRSLRDTNAVAQEMVDDAISDGKQYLAELEALFFSETEEVHDRPSDDELQQICMDVSLRQIGLKSLMAQRPQGGVQYRMAFESLLASFRLDLLDSYQSHQRCDLRSLLSVPLRSVRSFFLNLLGQNDEALREALFLLQRADQRLVAMLPSRDLQEYCDAALNNNVSCLASEAYALFVKAKTSSLSTSGLPANCKHNLARDGLLTNTDTFLALMRELLSQGQKITAIAILRSLRILPLTDSSVGQLNLRFIGQQRSRLVSFLAEVGLVEDAFELFQHWSHRRFDPESKYNVSSLRRSDSVQVVDPLIERQIRLMHDVDHQIATSSECLVALVRNICRQPLVNLASSPSGSGSEAEHASPGEDQDNRSRIPSDRLKKAKFVTDIFRKSCSPLDWTHYKLTALARACFIAKDVRGAFDALAKISFLRLLPDQVDIAVLLGGLVEHNADRAVNLFIRHCSVPETIGTEKKGKNAGKQEAAHTSTQKPPPVLAPMKPTAALTSMLMTRVIAQNRTDLVDKLYTFSKAVGLSSRLSYASSMRAVVSPEVSPSKVVQTINRMLQNGWTVDPGLLEKLAQRLFSRSMKRQPITGTHDASTAAPAKGRLLPPKERLHLVQAATHLMQISARDKELVNLRTVQRALDAIARAKPLFSSVSAVEAERAAEKASGASLGAARQRGREERRLQWITALDSIVHMLRWTRFFDTGDDYRQSLQLWKSSKGSNGEFVPAELEEMLDNKFKRRRHQQTRAEMSAVSAITLPTWAEAAAQSQAAKTVSDSSGNAALTQTDGVVQQVSGSSPNVLPADLYRRLIETYLAIGDACGAAEVASWMRDEAKVDMARTPAEASEFVDRIKAAVLERKTFAPFSFATKQQQERYTGDAGSTKFTAEPAAVESDVEGSMILRILASQQSTERTKLWWTP
ncbi:hypothetical protein NDA18_001169 [Ustilago nuda]|nr:hypothetical protein NDA18_001169 [Ustilago nuda]